MKKLLCMLLLWSITTQAIAQVTASRSTLVFYATATGTTVGPDSFMLTGAALSPGSGTVNLIAPANFVVASSPTGGYSGSYSISYTGGAFSVPVFVKYNCPATSSGLDTGCIAITGGGYAANVCLTGGLGCTATPAAGSISASTPSGDSTTTFYLYASGVATGFGITYQWQSSPDSTTWTNITRATDTFYHLAGITTNTYLRLQTTCVATGTTAYSNMVGLRYLSYCKPSRTRGYGGCGFISDFSLNGTMGTIRDTGACDSIGYIDKTTQSCQLYSGTTYLATIVTHGTFGVNYQAWIDLNNDGSFQYGERVGGINSATGTVTFAIIVPAGTTTGAYRMRLLGIWDASGYSYPGIDPCSSVLSYADTRDYTLNIAYHLPYVSATPASLGFDTVAAGTSTPPHSFAVSGICLVPAVGNVNVNAPPSFEVSLDSTTGFANAITIGYTGATLPTTNIFVRLLPTHAGYYSGCITISGGGIASSLCVPVNGIAHCNGTPTSGSVSATPTAADTASTITLRASGFDTGLGITYQWQSSADSAVWTDIAGATTTLYSLHGISQTTYFRLVTTCSYSASSGYSAGKRIDYMEMCAGTPVGGTASSSVSACHGCTAILSLTGNTIAGSIAYQWQQSTDSITWNNISGATNFSCNVINMSETFYRCKVTCGVSGQSAYSTVVRIYDVYSITSISTAYLPLGCTGKQFDITATPYSRGLSMKINYGDGTADSSGIDTATKHFAFNHIYPYSNTYRVRATLYNGSIISEDTVFDEQNVLCGYRAIRAYLDMNANGTRDSSEAFFVDAFLTKIDSNGVAIDTISSMMGTYYHLLGQAGTIYRYTPLLDATTYTVTAPSAGYITDTIIAGRYYYAPDVLFGIQCIGSGNNGVSLTTSVRPRSATGSIGINGSYFCDTLLTVVFNFSPKLVFRSSSKTPISIVGNAVSFHLTPVDAVNHINFTCNTFGYLLPGDTVHSSAFFGPLVNDTDTTDNSAFRVDTVKETIAANFIEASPTGCLNTTDTVIEYTIGFENFGNDTAHNIYILDTLSGNLNARSVKLLYASHPMVFDTWQDGNFTIVKFEFPNVMMPDSSHHDQSLGMVRYSVRVAGGLPDGTTIPARVGIYLDDAPVIMTNTCINTIGCPAPDESHLHAHQYRVYPNPTTSLLNVDVSPGAFETLVITNSIGQAVYSTTIASKHNVVNLSHLLPGIYFATLRGAKGICMEKFVKE